MTTPPFWLWDADASISYRFGNLLLRDAKLGVQNTREMLRAEELLRDTTGSLHSIALPWPDGYPVARLGLPNKGFAPDYFKFGSHHFGSRRLRDAMALPNDVVQHIPIELISGGDAVRAQDYRLLRIVAMQPALDLDRSECKVEELFSHVTGQPFKVLRSIDRFALLDGLQPRTEVFRIEEICTSILVVDAFAERVLRAGCTGMEFDAVDNMQSGKRVERYRTADGIAERRVGYLD
ncbi:imm11 family protein [Limobrevibacterium gyesilva]|uniref:Immunity MXAN-0049 protein domain-containing protein n=1 Tax=Limobrevibacterium gyesilva TaxID=2991712 RepID=A0AA41YIN6_9PROT|nr:DUF1629 domain-containing protein [Limobrevibacterium gyesilva]MCW3474314.1 hypothetical protein [Limobrevibacterium gyesilva]